MTIYIGRMTNPIEVAERIERLRVERGWSVARIEATTGIAEKTYRRRIADPDKFSIGELLALTSALGAGLEDVLTDSPRTKAVA